MKKILGLDLGTNSIGWALVSENGEKKEILGIGSRIIPMSQDVMDNFGKGISKSQTAERSGFRGVRRIRERYLLRRERLHRTLNLMGFLPEHYAQSIDFEKRLGKFKSDTEPKLVWKENETIGFDFIFKSSFNEMIEDFKVTQPDFFTVKGNGEEKKMPYDWTIYYLRKKALQAKIEKEELAWLLLSFNQKRGYYQLRGEEEEDNPNKLVEFHAMKVVDVTADEPQKGKNDLWYSVILENGWIYRRSSKMPLFDWKDKIKEFIVTTDLNDDGTVKIDREGVEKRSFRAPSEDDWTLIKKKTESDIEKSNKTVGCYIYDILLENPSQKINGKLVRTIERKFYKQELKAILEKQKSYHSELQNNKLYNECLQELYRNNEVHRKTLQNTDFTKLFVDDIVFYQRKLKRKKSLISNCPYEYRVFKNENGELIESPIKCIAKSHPLFQEFRLWQFISNLKIYKKDLTDIEVTNEYLKTDDDYVALFIWLNERKEIDQKTFLKYQPFGLKKNVDNYRWNYVEEKVYPCNKTRNAILAKLDKTEYSYLTQEIEIKIWHLLYSINSQEEINKALVHNTKRKSKKNKETKFEIFQELKDSFSIDSIEKIKNIKIEETNYGSYSAKAIKKLLPLMRMGKYWNESEIHEQTRLRIDKIINGEYDEKIRNRVREKAINLTDRNHFRNLPLWLTCYIVYDRHAESIDLKQWKIPEDIAHYLKNEFKQHSLRNPIVEQVITETLRVVTDIWKNYGEKNEKGVFLPLFDEIHIELGREMKNPVDIRKKMTEQITGNENTNLRIKALLLELKNDSEVENVRPYSPSQQEILKIYEEGVMNSSVEVPDDIAKIVKSGQPAKSELIRYKCWLEQGYRSPYTGVMISLTKLFTSAYEIEHIIPQSRYFDDSLSNKVICEAEVNNEKGNALGYEFIKKNEGRIIELNYSKKVKIFTVTEYEDFVKRQYGKNRSKMKKLLMEDIPDDFIERQLNDSRYISKVVKTLLSNIVREVGEQEATSKNVISCSGGITSILKQDWGLNDVWNSIIYPRFERMNEKTNSNNFGHWTNKEGKSVFQTEMPLELQKGFVKKRIDHRHHAMDALVIACATRNHVNYLNNEAAKSNAKESRFDLRKKLRRIEKIQIEKLVEGKKVLQSIDVAKEFYKPWETFTQDAHIALGNIVVSFKQNLRVINKSSNYYETYKDENGNLRLDKNGKPEKSCIKQTKGDNWAIRKSLHTPMPYGIKKYKFDKLKLAENVGKVELIINDEIKRKVQEALNQFSKKISETQKYLKNNPILDNEGRAIINTEFKMEVEKYRRRQPISKLSNRGQGGIKTTEEAIDFINKVADIKLQHDLLSHLKLHENDLEKAFNAEGIERFNQNRKVQVYKLPIAESGKGRFAVGNGIGTKHKFVEADKGTNLFFAIYVDESKNRGYDTIPLNIVIERLKQNQKEVPETNEKGGKLLMFLSPNDLVYIPTLEELQLTQEKGYRIRTERIYKMVSSSGTQCFFVPNIIASPVVQTIELGANNKSEKTWDGQMIKQVCIKLKVDRLGNISI
ncbi:MAG: type II CRISPR RNA-guided endonuclease Cas9 [Bacteroidia bacterium]